MFINIFFVLTNIILFINGLLPLRSKNEQLVNVQYEAEQFSEPGIDRTVIMIVDAIRTDFVSENLMPLTTKLIKEHGCLINVSVSSPTVTLPRIKSLITGSIPQFMDVLHNLGSPQVLEDSLLHKARKRNKKIVFHGDETWLNIFWNDTFLRYTGTTSLYVKDFYEVDNNVTRNLDLELEKNDWDIMILHYLGLDHIGHVHGPFSHLVPQKLHEMDVILSRIFTSLTRNNLSSLVVLTGDHGMRDTGGHGGSTYPETHVPFGVLGVPCDNGLMDQVDIAPNLAVLLGLEIPSLSIGKLTRLLLKNLKVDEYASALYYNAELLSKKYGDRSEFESISEIYRSYRETNDENEALRLIEMCTKYSEKVSGSLRESSTQQDLNAMIVSVICLFYSLITHLNRSELFKKRFFNNLFYLSLLLLRLVSEELVLIPVLIASVFQILKLSKIKLEKHSLILVVPIFFQPLTWLSSSFIEEEHEFWYFILNTFFIFQMYQKIKKRNFASFIVWFSLSISFRFGETLNQMGDKWASLPDTADLLLKPENYYFHVALLCLSVFSIYYFCLRYGKSFYYLEKIILFLVFIYKLSLPDHFFLPRIIYALTALYLVLSSDYLNSWIILIAFLSKSYNLCLIPLSVYTSRRISNEYKSEVLSTCLHLIMIKSLYFMQGNGNTIASIDVSVGYTALTNYNPFFVGAQLLISTYSSTILLHLLLFKSENTKKTFSFLYAERLYTTIVVCIVSLIFRNHIFIWSVYAPKLCIECCHTLVLVVEFSFYLLISSVFKRCNNLDIPISTKFAL